LPLRGNEIFGFEFLKMFGPSGNIILRSKTVAINQDQSGKQFQSNILQLKIGMDLQISFTVLVQIRADSWQKQPE
jgi:hypothetical protein